MSVYRHLGIAVALSPRMQPLLNEAAVQARALAERVSLVHVGVPSDDKEDLLREAVVEAGLPPETPLLWQDGAPDEALIKAAADHEIDFLIAGALEKETGLKYYLGSVARNLVRSADFSLMLLTQPRLEPEPFKRAVLVTDYSENSLISLVKLLRYAEATELDEVHVVRVVSDFGDAIVMSEGMLHSQGQKFKTRSLEEEESLLQDFVDSAGETRVNVIPKCLQGHSGYVVSTFARDMDADLLVIPSTGRGSHFFERLFPSDMEWVLREIPCNLWVVRDVPPLA